MRLMLSLTCVISCGAVDSSCASNSASDAACEVAPPADSGPATAGDIAGRYTGIVYGHVVSIDPPTAGFEDADHAATMVISEYGSDLRIHEEGRPDCNDLIFAPAAGGFAENPSPLCPPVEWEEISGWLEGDGTNVHLGHTTRNFFVTADGVRHTLTTFGRFEGRRE
jgi:hypothetical protein